MPGLSGTRITGRLLPFRRIPQRLSGFHLRSRRVTRLVLLELLLGLLLMPRCILDPLPGPLVGLRLEPVRSLAEVLLAGGKFLRLLPLLLPGVRPGPFLAIPRELLALLGELLLLFGGLPQCLVPVGAPAPLRLVGLPVLAITAFPVTGLRLLAGLFPQMLDQAPRDFEVVRRVSPSRIRAQSVQVRASSGLEQFDGLAWI